MPYKIHPLADVQTDNIGENTNVWQFCVVLAKAKIGSNCNICSHCLIENDVIIGDNVTVKSGVQIWDGITIEDSVFIGPNVTFTNDLFPRSKNAYWIEVTTMIRKNASIGANATILAGVEIAKFSMIGAGSVLTKSTDPYSLWYGNPAQHKGYITPKGIVLDCDLVDAKTGNTYQLIDGELTIIR
ncbi:dTDP-3-amino-3,6-dideoxy-alpha-D-galactopyranose 3-N-acetyltransferase [compost metagenome]